MQILFNYYLKLLLLLTNYHIYYFFITTLLKNNSIKNALNENILRIRIFTAIF